MFALCPTWQTASIKEGLSACIILHLRWQRGELPVDEDIINRDDDSGCQNCLFCCTQVLHQRSGEVNKITRGQRQDEHKERAEPTQCVPMLGCFPMALGLNLLLTWWSLHRWHANATGADGTNTTIPTVSYLETEHSLFNVPQQLWNR